MKMQNPTIPIILILSRIEIILIKIKILEKLLFVTSVLTSTVHFFFIALMCVLLILIKIMDIDILQFYYNVTNNTYLSQ